MVRPNHRLNHHQAFSADLLTLIAAYDRAAADQAAAEAQYLAAKAERPPSLAELQERSDAASEAGWKGGDAVYHYRVRTAADIAAKLRFGIRCRAVEDDPESANGDLVIPLLQDLDRLAGKAVSA